MRQHPVSEVAPAGHSVRLTSLALISLEIQKLRNSRGAAESLQRDVMANLYEKANMKNGRVVPRRQGSYGIDAPFAPAFMAVMIVFVAVTATLSGRWRNFVPVPFMLAILGLYLHSSLRGKFVVWADLLDRLKLRGDERVLDLGCGRGAVLLMAAQHLTTGRAVGVDLWRSADQSGKSLDATQRNAIAEGVADRVDLHTADMTVLPFEDDCFDVVVSSFAIHNISGAAGREKAIVEAVRVLRPGGRLIIADIRATRLYEK